MSSNTSGSPSRRERLRTETIDEIKTSARDQLREHGPNGISLRAVAREMGMSPAALYRYFDGLDALLTELCCDFYDELIDVSGTAMDAHPPECHMERMKTWIWSFRAWAVSHRPEFELMLNLPDSRTAMANPVQTADSRLDDLTPVGKKSIEHAQLCGRELAAYHRQTEGEDFDFAAVQTPELSEGLREEIHERCGALIFGEPLPVSWMFAFMSAWVRVFGLVTMEAFGSLPIQDHVEEFYKAQMMVIIKEFGIAP